MDRDVAQAPLADAEADRAFARQRASVRESMLLLSSLLRVGDGEERPPASLRIRNLSAGGLMADCDRPLDRGDRVVVTLRGIGEVAGTIVWAHDDRIGVQFDRAIDPRATRKPIARPSQGRTLVMSQDTRRPAVRGPRPSV